MLKLPEKSWPKLSLRPEFEHPHPHAHPPFSICLSVVAGLENYFA